jgi:uncharacterized damage-inducible protein DinB
VRINDIRTLYDYLFWAHERMMVPVAELSPEELTRDLGSGLHSVRDTLVHMMSSEWIWLSRWHGISPSTLLDAEAFPTVEALEDRWGRIRVELQRFLGLVREGDLLRPLLYRSIEGEDVEIPLVFTMEHLVHHCTYHRGQMAVLVRQLGKQPLPTDLIRYYLEEEASAIEQSVRRWEHAHAAHRAGGEPHGPEGAEEDED